MSKNKEPAEKIIAEQKQIIKKQGNQIKYLENIIFLMPGHVYWVDKTGLCRGCNQNLAILMQVNFINDLTGKSPYSLMPKEIAARTKANDQEVIKSKKEHFFEENGFDENGNPAVYLTRKVPLYDENSDVNGVLGISLNITDRKHAEELEKILDQQKIENLHVLSSIIAHELRTPLGSIALNYDLIEMTLTRTMEIIISNNPKLYEEKITDNFANILKFGEQINNVIKRTSATINLLLNNIKEEKIDPTRFVKVSINDDIKHVLQTYPFVGDEIQKVHYKRGNDFKYCGDPNLTQLIITNLLKNALYHVTIENKGEIYISLESDKNHLIFYDTGIGIPKKLLPKIFKRFATGRPGGTGLGLTFCKMVMQAMQGDITCDSKEGEYTNFTLVFPSCETYVKKPKNQK